MKSVVGLILLAASSSMSFAADAPSKNWPLSSNDTAPEVKAAFNDQCAKWSKENQAQGLKTSGDDFIKQCEVNLAAVWPIGLDKPSGE